MDRLLQNTNYLGEDNMAYEILSTGLLEPNEIAISRDHSDCPLLISALENGVLIIAHVPPDLNGVNSIKSMFSNIL